MPARTTLASLPVAAAFGILAVAATSFATTSRTALAAAPVLSAPKPGVSGQQGKDPGLPPPALPESSKQPSGDAGKTPPAADHHDHDSQSDPSKVIETVDLPRLPVLMMASKSTWVDGYSAIRAAIAALRTEAERAKLEPKGRPLVTYVESDDSGFRFDVLLPLASEPSATLQLSDGFRTGHNPGGKAIKFEHRGAYSDIETTYEAITAYLDQKDLRAREFFIEEIVNDIADPGDIKMAVNIYVFLH